LLDTRDRLEAVFFANAELELENAAEGPLELSALAQALNTALIALVRDDQSVTDWRCCRHMPTGRIRTLINV